LSFILITQFSLAGETPRVIRDPDPKRTPNGLYRSSQLDSTMGEKVAELNPDAIESYFASNPSLDPQLIYIEKASGKRVTDESKLKEGLENQTIRATVDRDGFFLVGPALFGDKARQLKKLTEEVLSEKYPDQEIPVRRINRPVKPDFSDANWAENMPKPIVKCAENVCMAVQEVVFLFPLPQDYQKPVRAEIDTTVSKLVIANGIRQIAVGMMKKPDTPWHVIINSGIADFGNSALTGTYQKTMANWFNRSKSGYGRFARAVQLGIFFTTDMYWSSRAKLSDFLKIMTKAGWGKMILDSYASLGFNLLWRYFVDQSFFKWEKQMTDRGRKEDARRTRSKLSFWAGVIVAPGFVYSVIFPRWLDLHYLHLNEGHFWMLAMGAVGAAYYYGMPVYRFATKKWTPLTWDPWVERFDKISAFNQKVADAMGLTKLIDTIKDQFKSPPPVAWQYDGDIRDAISVDPAVIKIMAGNPDVARLIHCDFSLKQLVEKDPYFGNVHPTLGAITVHN
jgi:hypothetical protein